MAISIGHKFTIYQTHDFTWRKYTNAQQTPHLRPAPLNHRHDMCGFQPYRSVRLNHCELWQCALCHVCGGVEMRKLTKQQKINELTRDVLWELWWVAMYAQRTAKWKAVEDSLDKLKELLS